MGYAVKVLHRPTPAKALNALKVASAAVLIGHGANRAIRLNGHDSELKTGERKDIPLTAAAIASTRQGKKLDFIVVFACSSVSSDYKVKAWQAVASIVSGFKGDIKAGDFLTNKKKLSVFSLAGYEVKG